MQQRVKGREGLVRDPHTNAIINTDKDALAKAKAKKKARLQELDKITRLEQQVADLNNKVERLERMIEGANLTDKTLIG